MDDERHWFEKFTLSMEKNIKGVQYGIYSVAIVGLAVALRSVRPFKKFTSVHEIPSSFLERHITLSGKVMHVEASTGSLPPLLFVDHHPIVAWQWRQSTSSCLPLHISSVDILNNGVSWLQHVMIGKDVRFTLLKTNPESISCIVRANTKCGNIGVDLVSLGFASVSSLDFDLEKDSVYAKYYKQLLAAENRAERQGLGMWANHEVSWSSRLLRQLWDRLKYSIPWHKIKQNSANKQIIKVA